MDSSSLVDGIDGISLSNDYIAHIRKWQCVSSIILDHCALENLTNSLNEVDRRAVKLKVTSYCSDWLEFVGLRHWKLAKQIGLSA